MGGNGNEVSQYTLTTAWDISTATYIAQTNYSYTSFINAIYLSSDGTKLYTITSGGVKQWTFGTPWDITTAVTDAATFTSIQSEIPEGIFFSPDGLRMYHTGTIQDRVYQYDLSAAWDITTLSFVRSFSIASQTTNCDGLYFKSDGTRMYVISAGISEIYEYSLSTAWNISTASYVQKLAISASDINTFHLAISTDGDKLFVGSENDNMIMEYALGEWSPPTKNSVTLTAESKS